MVGTIWAESLVVEDPAERSRLVQSLATCLGQTGLAVDSDASFETVTDLLSAETFEPSPATTACVESHDKLFYVSINEVQ